MQQLHGTKRDSEREPATIGYSYKNVANSMELVETVRDSQQQ